MCNLVYNEHIYNTHNKKTYYLHRAESFLRSQELLNWSRKCTESLQCSQELHWTLFLTQINPVQTLKPHFLTLCSILILPSHLSPGHPNFLIKILYALLTSPKHVTCPTQLILLDWISPIIFDTVDIMKLLTMQFSSRILLLKNMMNTKNTILHRNIKCMYWCLIKHISHQTVS